MYTSNYNNSNSEVLSNLEPSTKYTEYLKTLSSGDVGSRGGRGNYYDDDDDNGTGDGGGGRRSRRRRRQNNNNLQRSTPLLPISDNEVKFSHIFSPNESNALKLHLLQKTSSLPLLDTTDTANNNARGGSRNGAFGGGGGGGDDNDDDGGSAVDDHDDDDPRLRTRRRSTALGLLHDNHNSNNNNSNDNPRRKGDPVASILYSTIRHGAATNNINNNSNEYDDNPSADETLHTGSDSKVDYDPHEPLAAVDQIALRHELLNNIRAISRATYFEDLYTGKVRRNSGSPETEILRLLENPHAAAAAAARAIAEDSLGERTIPSKDTNLSRVDRWVKETSAASSLDAQNNNNNNDTDEDKEGQHASLYHQSVWDEEQTAQATGKKVVGGHRRGGGGNDNNDGGGGGGVSDATTESDVETPSAFVRRTTKNSKYQQVSKAINPVPDPDNADDDSSGGPKRFSKNTDRTVVSRSMGKPTISSGIIESSSSYLQAKYLHDSKEIIPFSRADRFVVVETPSSQQQRQQQHGGARRPFSFGISSSVDDLIPLSVSLPNVAENVALHGTALMRHSRPPDNLTHSMANLSTGATTATTSKITSYNARLDKRKLNAASNNNEQVYGRRGPLVYRSLPNKAASKATTTRTMRASSDRAAAAVPGLYSRLNMNQWVVKKVCFYVMGDDLHPRFEYRFRPGKDIRDLDQLLDILTKRFQTLPAGARHIFTMDGYPINSLEELLNENSYVVSSTRKFKAIKYGGNNGGRESENFGVLPDMRGTNKRGGGGVQKGHKGLSRQLSASDGNLNRSKRDVLFPHSQSLLGVQKGMSSSVNSKSVSDVPRLVAHVIEEASSNAKLLNSSSSSPLMTREPIRVINGARPSMQSQVLLNTKTSQPFEDLVHDLAISVRVPKQPIGNCLKTLAGRQIKSYSQLRSELKVGQRAFFIYAESKPAAVASPLSPSPTTRHSNRNGKPVAKAALGKVNSNSSSDLSLAATTGEGALRSSKRRSQQQRQEQRRRSHSPIITTNSRDSPRSPSPYHFN